MGAGKALAIVAGLLVLVATFVLTWGGPYQNGLVIIPTFMSLLSDLSLFGILKIVVAILVLISGVLILIGAKVRALAIIGAILPLFIGLTLLLNALGMYVIPSVVYTYINLSVFSGNYSLVKGIIPFSFSIANFSIGAIVLFVGGILGLISGIMGRKKY